MIVTTPPGYVNPNMLRLIEIRKHLQGRVEFVGFVMTEEEALLVETVRASIDRDVDEIQRN